MTLFGVGAGVATGYFSLFHVGRGIAYRTFTASITGRRSYTYCSGSYGNKIQATFQNRAGKAIKAMTNDREIELEMVSAKTPKIRTVAKQGIFFKDRATTTEIIMQTERVLGV